MSTPSVSIVLTLVKMSCLHKTLSTTNLQSSHCTVYFTFIKGSSPESKHIIHYHILAVQGCFNHMGIQIFFLNNILRFLIFLAARSIVHLGKLYSLMLCRRSTVHNKLRVSSKQAEDLHTVDQVCIIQSRIDIQNIMVFYKGRSLTRRCYC